MKFQEFIQASEQLIETLDCQATAKDARFIIRKIENQVISEQGKPLRDWSQQEHEAAIKKASFHFDNCNIDRIVSEQE